MKVGLVNYRVNPEMAEHIHVHRAAKQHICHGGHNGERHVHCPDPIAAGTVYVEYTGESIPFQSGKRYHVACAEQQGLVQHL